MVLPGDEIDPTPDEPLTAAAKKKLAKKKRLRALVKDHFVTAVSLSNRSKNPIEFAYDSQEGAKCHFYITLSDQDGNVYWESPSPVEEVDNPVSALRTRLNADGEEEENYDLVSLSHERNAGTPNRIFPRVHNLTAELRHRRENRSVPGDAT